jgi:lipoprotein
MNTITRRIATLVAALSLAVTAAGCANTPTATPTTDTADSQAALDAINNASEITATKSLFSWGDEWVIEADGNKVGTVTGQALYSIGDVYSLATVSGNLVASETEEMSAITHTATLYDWGNQPTGKLEERLVTLAPTVDIIHTTSNGSNETVGTSTTDFASLTHQTTITDNAGTVAWNTERHAFTLRTTITITRNNAGGTVTGIDALMVTLMMSEIHRSDK